VAESGTDGCVIERAQARRVSFRDCCCRGRCIVARCRAPLPGRRCSV